MKAIIVIWFVGVLLSLGVTGLIVWAIILAVNKFLL